MFLNQLRLQAAEHRRMNQTSPSLCFALIFVLIGSIAAVSWGQGANSKEKTLHVTVEPGVTPEVLDWGGTGTPVVLLARSEKIVSSKSIHLG